MPKRSDIHTILIIGSGPIVIGQACEFDYSGAQACKALREEGYRVVLVNSNPATIMTDPGMADATYIEPLDVASLERIIAKERPDALLPTVGGQTALNLAVDLHEAGVLERYHVALIGASVEAVRVAEDRQLFKDKMIEIGLQVPRSGTAHTVDEALEVVDLTGFPAIIRPSFTLGGSGGGIAYNMEEFKLIVERGLDASPVTQVLIEESVLGWKEFELEVMRDRADNGVIICSIENIDPMGVHTGDSITVAPAMTLTDREYQQLRDQALAVLRAVGVETGGSNVQFAVSPTDGRIYVIEMNPRVSRSSALASKATGFPIAKIAAKLAVGYTLDELPNDITRETPASFEPTLDYVVVKIPRWTFEKFVQADTTLTTAMKSVGEVMAIGRTFPEAFQKAWRSLEQGRMGWGADGKDQINPERLHERLITPTPERMFYVRYALQSGMSPEQINMFTKIDPWFLEQLEQVVNLEGRLRAFELSTVPADLLRQAKRMGFSDAQLAILLRVTPADVQTLLNETQLRPWSLELAVRARRKALGIIPTFHRVDTCAAEFPAFTPYLYSSYETEDEAEPTTRQKVMILGSGPNRIGQGIEFDYCCVHAVFGLRAMGYETIMVNCNPETVSTDYDTADRLYFEPLTLEDVLNIVDLEKPSGVLVQFGGQTPLKLARALEAAGVPIWGTPPDAIDLAEDRDRFGALLDRLEIPAPAHGSATSWEEALHVATAIGYPLVVRPSYVLGGRAMAIVYDDETLERYMREAVDASPEHPVLIDRFLEDAFEMDVDCIADGNAVEIAGIMEQIELAGVHSGDSACVIPTYMVPPEHEATMRAYTVRLAKELGVIGLMNIQYAMKDGVVYVLEANPRASRTIPFVAKATGVPWAQIAAQCTAGRPLAEWQAQIERGAGQLSAQGAQRYHVKEVVLPWVRFAGVDTLLGPEMRSTGEAMGSGATFGEAFAKAQLGCGHKLPMSGNAFLSVNDRDKASLLPIARGLAELGFKLIATGGTAAYLRSQGLAVTTIFKVNEGRPNTVDYIKNNEVAMIVNTPLGKASFFDEVAIRHAAIVYGIPMLTTLSGAAAAVEAIRSLRDDTWTVLSLQERAG
ncbi:carbamoyl-phosphate synthase large subunit [Candidatus Viridilinea mediisalina]|uniref:Carbamoyl phosphate synthase large chain n=1 Tax=Candidatus Viridilinea mediisalina TaxID=2024553 RepID=A0A2A6REY8_9CHLR|nr:carbamoyl-phosphate synthase large subunit [Candidatus Viridilinea mediisalina]PDW01503.1 carbamoyl phosphate synthase large subunit [Candidatus Viridilinea mediisalina]